MEHDLEKRALNVSIIIKPRIASGAVLSEDIVSAIGQLNIAGYRPFKIQSLRSHCNADILVIGERVLDCREDSSQMSV